MENVAVIGGGIAGITAALTLKKNGVKNVFLIDKDEQCGGLLKSTKNENDIYFDIGTHIPCETLNTEIDNLLFSKMHKENWYHFEYLNTGNFFKGKLYEESQFIYAPFLEENLYLKGLFELLNCDTSDNKEYVNLLEYCNAVYGPTFTEEIYTPLMKKLVGKELEDLHTNALNIFSLSRLVPGNDFLSENLKKSDVYDKKLAYSTFEKGISPQKKYYPKAKGVGLWIEDLISKMIDSGITIINNSTICKVEYMENHITSITLDNSVKVNVDLVIWTIPPVHLLSLIGRLGSGERPEFRTMSIHNFLFDKPFLTNNHYINCVDENYRTFRITLYSNISNEEQRNPYNCTVEVLIDNKLEDLKKLNEDLIEELKGMGIVERDAQVLFKEYYNVENSFPVITPNFVQMLEEQKKIVESQFDNVILAGKASGDTFFMTESIMKIHQDIVKYMNDEVNFKSKI